MRERDGGGDDGLEGNLDSIVAGHPRACFSYLRRGVHRTFANTPCLEGLVRDGRVAAQGVVKGFPISHQDGHLAYGSVGIERRLC